jgi:hypothetical protein
MWLLIILITIFFFFQFQIFFLNGLFNVIFFRRNLLLHQCFIVVYYIASRLSLLILLPAHVLQLLVYLFEIVYLFL